MALVETRTFEEGTNGAAILSGANGIVAINSAPTYTSSGAIHGALAAACGDSAAVNYAAGNTGSISVYGTVTTVGGGSGILIGLKNASSHQARVGLSVANKFTIANSAGTPVATSTASWVVGTAFRVDCQWSWDGVNIAVTARVFLGANMEGFEEDEALTATFAAGLAITRISLGNTSVGWANVVDTVRRWDTLIWPVPYGAPAANLSGRPVAVESNTGWTVTGAATSTLALADASDASYAASGTVGTTTQRWKLSPTTTPDTSLIRIRADLTAASAGTFTVKLYEGTTLQKTWTQTLTTSIADYDLVIDSTTLAAVADWSNLYVETTWVA